MRLGRLIEKVSAMDTLIERCTSILDEDEEGSTYEPLLPDEIYEMREYLKEYVKLIRSREIEI